MWILKTILAEQESVGILGLELFRVIFAVACIVKFTVEARRGYRFHMSPLSFVRATYDAAHTDGGLFEAVWWIVYRLRLIAALCLLLGWWSLLASGALALCFAVECRIFFKFHVCYFCLISMAICLGSHSGVSLGKLILILSDAVSGGSEHSAMGIRGNWLSHALIAETTIALYWFSAIQKMRSPDFIGGRAIHAALLYAFTEGTRRRHFEAYLPTWVIESLVVGRDMGAIRKRWAAASRLVICSEILVPAGLLCSEWPNIQLATAAYGAFMHACFTLLAPATLFHFSLATVGSYLVFLDPQKLAQSLECS
jgi:hypothetical protein